MADTRTRKYWRNEDWEWRRKQRLEFPHFWTLKSNAPPDDPDAQWEFRAMFGSIPLPASWPVYVSHAEASAYARWAGKKLPDGRAMASRGLWHDRSARASVSVGR